MPPTLHAESLDHAFTTLRRTEQGDNRELLNTVLAFYRTHGIRALATPFLQKQKDRLYHRLLAAGLKQPALLAELGLMEEYAAWKGMHRSYRGDVKPIWTYATAAARARVVAKEMGDLPTVQWFRTHGLAALTTAVHTSGRTWEDLRTELGLPPTRKFSESKNGMRWLSQPEALFSDYLFDRSIEHKRGERYPADFSAKTGRKWARYDLHFCANGGNWIDVEIWGEPDGGPGATLNSVSAGRYRAMKGIKETWNRNRPDFLGISYTDCYAPKRLAEILTPYVGDIQISEVSSQRDAEKSLYRDKDELLDECRKLAATMPDGIFPADSWLRARGKYEGRPGPVYNSLSIYVFRWLGGTRQVRELLGQGSASTTKWDESKVRTEWAAFLAKTGLTPSQAKGKNRIAELPPETVNEAGRIYRVAHELGLLESLRNGGTARRIIWTPKNAVERWRAFEIKTGRSPTECMSRSRRKALPREIVSEATCIYGAARRLGVLVQARKSKSKG